MTNNSHFHDGRQQRIVAGHEDNALLHEDGREDAQHVVGMETQEDQVQRNVIDRFLRALCRVQHHRQVVDAHLLDSHHKPRLL